MGKVKTVSILVAFLIFCSLFSYGQAGKLFRKGLRADDIHESIAFFDKAIVENPKHLNAHFYRGLYKSELEDYFGAILDFTTVISIKPDPDSFYNRANAKFSLGDFKGAHADYLEAINWDRSFYEAYYNLGITQLNLKKYKAALRSFNFLLANDPSDFMLYTHVGYTLLKLGYYKYAFLFYNTSIKLDNSSLSYYNRGLAYLEINKFDEAKKDFQKAIKLDHKNASAHYYHGMAELFSRNYDGAISSFDNALSFKALDYEALFGSAIAHFHANDLEKAKAHYNKAKNILNPKGNKFDSISLFETSSWYEDERSMLALYFDKLNSL